MLTTQGRASAEAWSGNDGRRARAAGKAAASTAADVHVAVIGGDLLFREGLKRLFADSRFGLVGEWETVTDMEQSEDVSRDVDLVVLVDITSDVEMLIGQLARMRRVWPTARTMALGARGGDQGLVGGLQAGIDGLMPKETSPEALLQAMGLVHLGENLLPTRIGRMLLRGSTGGRASAPESISLTPREKDILEGLLVGESNKMIANRLGTTDMTVKAQLRHLLRKIGATNRTQAALWAREHGAAHGVRVDPGSG